MKFREIVRFELTYQLRRAWPWLFLVVLVVFSFLLTRDGSLAEALVDDFFVNSPFAIAKNTVVGSLIWLLVAGAVAGEAGARDVETGIHPLTYTAGVRTLDYLGARFLAALTLNALLLLGVQAGILLAIYTPGIDAAAVGPFRPAAFITAYAYIALPTAIVATAIQFALASLSGRAMASYAGSLFLFFMGFIVTTVLAFNLGRPELAKLLDPIGVQFVVSDMSHLWTTYEKSWRLVELEGTILVNRLIWLGVAAVALALTYQRFRFTHRTSSGWWWPFGARRRVAAQAPTPGGLGISARTPVAVPQSRQAFDVRIHARKSLAIAWDSFRAIGKSWAGLAMLVGLPLLSVLVVVDQMVLDGVPLVPTTARVLTELTGPLAASMSRWVIVPLLIIYFAGALVWREREAGLGEITDAMPLPEWVPFLGKFLGLTLLLVVFLVLLSGAGMLSQLVLGHRDVEPGLYLTVLFGLQLPEYLLMAVLALVVHGLVDQKYVAHLVASLIYVVIALAPVFGIHHDLLIYGAGPGWSYTAMRDFGPFLGPWLWFKLYWAAWALLLGVVARLLWVRGREGGLAARFRMARQRVTRATAWTGAAAALLIVGLGGFIFYNTNVLNEYRTASDGVERRAEYERRYARYARTPQPRLTGTRLHVEIHPERRSAEIRGSYQLVNRSAVPIDSLHLATMAGSRPDSVEFDQPAALVLDDDDHGHRIYALERPLQPGDSLRMSFRVRIEPRGFTEGGIDPSVVANGTFFSAGALLPAIGYQRDRELLSYADRRAQGLASRPVVPSLYDSTANQSAAGRIAFDAVVGTAADQVAVAPGALRRSWTENGRRYFHYTTDAPIGADQLIFSARYAVHDARWTPDTGTGSGSAGRTGKGVAVKIYHHPGHDRNVDRMLRSVRASLDYHTEQFGPYPHSYLTLVERPGHGTGMSANASMLSYGEGYSMWNPRDEPGSLDLPFAIVAHEIGHQWWGGQLPYAVVEGAPVLSESLAWYSAMQVVGKSLGRDQLRRLLTFMRQPHRYPPIRRGEPLLRGLDPYMSYRKGPLSLYALSEYMGADRVNLALRRLLDQHRSGEPPLATTLDLYRELQAVTPDSLRPLLHDLFEVNTIWELRADEVSAEQTAGGAWQVTLDVRARKVVVDSAGVESVVPMDEWVEIGVFAPGDERGELSEPLYVGKHRIRSGEQTITVTVPRQPALAGIDPYHVLDWEERESDDNIEPVRVRN